MARVRWWGTTKDQQTRQETSAVRETDDDLPAEMGPIERTHRGRPGRKNTKEWCKGKVGRHHAIAIAIPAHSAISPTCGWKVRHYLNDRRPRMYYVCAHAEMCTTCGKVLRSWRSQHRLAIEECPLFTPQGA